MRRIDAVWIALALSGLVWCACSAPARVPPGLPPPEYERSTSTPWPQVPDAGVEPGVDAGSSEGEPSAAGAPGE